MHHFRFQQFIVLTSELLHKKQGMRFFHSLFFCLPKIERDSRVGAVLREQNALPYESRITYNLTAKAAIDNCRAGRAAKGAKLSLRATALEF